MLHSLSPPSLHLAVPASVCNNKGSERRLARGSKEQIRVTQKRQTDTEN